MNSPDFLRAMAESTLPLNDEERALLAAHIAQEVHWHMRVRRLKEERVDTLPPPFIADTIPIAEAGALLARGELPLAVSFEGLPEAATRCELPTIPGDE